MSHSWMYVEHFEVYKNFGYDLRFYPNAMLKRKFLHKEDINLVNQIQIFFSVMICIQFCLKGRKW